MTKRACPVCGGLIFRQAVKSEAIQTEFELQEEFIDARLRRKAAPAERKDLTDFMHGVPAPLLECVSCGLLVRAEDSSLDAASYEEDPNDLDLMAQVYPKYLKAFLNKEIAYRDRLRPHADVLELGSHLGAFLETAERWNWHPSGLDIGRDTSEFVRRRGFKVIREAVEDARLPSEHYDAVFVWNCFEQLPDPADALARIRPLLRPHGLLVVRVPNALPYRMLRGAANSHGGFVRKALAYNNLLGFPYLYGYTVEHLVHLLAPAGFRFVEAFNTELVTLPFPDNRRPLVDEQRAMSRKMAGWSMNATRRSGRFAAPWIEAVFRKDREIPVKIPRRISTNSDLFLPRAA